MTVVFGPNLIRRSPWFEKDERGVYVLQRGFAYVFLAIAGLCVWIGVLTVLID